MLVIVRARNNFTRDSLLAALSNNVLPDLALDSHPPVTLVIVHTNQGKRLKLP